MAVMVGALIGPAQVGARILEFGLLRKVHPLLSARIAAALHPIGALAFGVAGAPVWRPTRGGQRHSHDCQGHAAAGYFRAGRVWPPSGLVNGAGRVAQAMAPWLFGMLLDSLGARVLWVSSALGFASILTLFLLHGQRRTAAAAA